MTNQLFHDQYKILLNPQQEAAVQAADGPVLLLAVPGSGKTTVLVTRLGYLVFCRGVLPREILTMTYTVAATRDMRERFAALFGSACAAEMEFRTINGVCAKIIRRYEQEQGRTAFRLISDESVLSALVGELYRQQTGEYATESDIKAVRTLITYAKNMLLDEEAIGELPLDGCEFLPLYQAYNRELRNREWMDYDDQMIYADRILRQYPDILRYFQETWRYLCVDEAQDTSKIQHQIIRRLAGKNHQLFMVGDEDQSIYGFRAAYPEALMEFGNVYPEATVLLMEQNYRSTPQIVQAAGKFIALNQNRREKHMVTQRAAGAPVKAISVRDRKAQYSYLLKVAKDCRQETAVLYRDNDSALPVIDLLERNGIPYRCRQMDSTFFSHFIIRDLTDIMELAQDPSDGEKFLRIYYKLGAGITKAAAVYAAAQSRIEDRPVLEIIQEIDSLSQWTRMQAKALQTHLQNLRDEPADRAVYRIVHFMGYGNYLEERGADTGKIDILEALAAREPNPQRLLERLEELKALTAQGSAGEESQFILSTIHSSKGLEYDRVVLMDVADGILPKVVVTEGKNPSKEDAAALEEERRLFYVAMTRAREELLIFRFQKEDLASSFADAVLPEKRAKKQERKTFSPAPKPAERYHAPQDVSAASRSFLPACRVEHRKFGSGTLESRNGSIATIRFDDGSVRRLDLTIALRQNLLKRTD